MWCTPTKSSISLLLASSTRHHGSGGKKHNFNVGIKVYHGQLQPSFLRVIPHILRAWNSETFIFWWFWGPKVFVRLEKTHPWFAVIVSWRLHGTGIFSNEVIIKQSIKYRYNIAVLWILWKNVTAPTCIKQEKLLHPEFNNLCEAINEVILLLDTFRWFTGFSRHYPDVRYPWNPWGEPDGLPAVFLRIIVCGVRTSVCERTWFSVSLCW